jgi:uncharacterized membrane protein
MFDLYTVLKFLHIVFAMFWVGSAILLAVLAVRAQKASEPDALLRFTKDAGFVGEKVLAPVSGVLFLLGVLLVLKGYPDFSDTWVLLAIVGWAVTVAIGVAVLTPQGKKLEALLAEKPSSDPEVTAQVKKLLLVSRLDIVVLLLIVADMVFKPGL